MSGFETAVSFTEELKIPPSSDIKYTGIISPEVITKRTIDNITYTIKSRSSESATQTLRTKLEASIARDIAKTT